MSTATPATPPESESPPRSRWWQLAALGILAVAGILALYWWYLTESTRRDWELAETEASLDLPRWRLLELEADRPNVPDDENSALLIIKLRQRAGGVHVSAAPNYEQIFENLPPTAQLNAQQQELLRERLELIGKEVEETYKLKDMPRGRFPITYADDGFSTLIPHHQESRIIMDWLQNDAYLRAQTGDLDKAVAASEAMLVAGKAFETDLFHITFLIRVSFVNNAVLTLERTLAQGQPSESALLQMQKALEREFDNATFLLALRGERAMMHHLFCNVRDGKVQSLQGMFGAGANDSFMRALQAFFADHFPTTLLKHYPEFLRSQNRLVELGKLPLWERQAKLEEWESEVTTSSNPLIRPLMPAVHKVSRADCRTQAMLRSAAVAFACERYRLAKKAWPDSLEELVKEKLLDAIPIDPFDGQPIRYRRTKDGIVVYSVGVDCKDDGGNIDRHRFMDPGVDIGFQLWNPNRRRQAPLPPVVVRAPE